MRGWTFWNCIELVDRRKDCKRSHQVCLLLVCLLLYIFSFKLEMYNVLQKRMQHLFQ